MAEPSLELIQAQLERLLEGQRLIRDDLTDVKQRLTSLDVKFASLRSEVALLHGDYAGQSLRIDRIDQRLERIEKRLDLVDAS
jgi:hypothetical protein